MLNSVAGWLSRICSEHSPRPQWDILSPIFFFWKFSKVSFKGFDLNAISCRQFLVPCTPSRNLQIWKEIHIYKKRPTYVFYPWVMSHTNESCLIQMSHVSYKWVMSHINESCLIQTSRVTYTVNLSCVMTMRLTFQKFHQSDGPRTRSRFVWILEVERPAFRMRAVAHICIRNFVCNCIYICITMYSCGVTWPIWEGYMQRHVLLHIYIYTYMHIWICNYICVYM